ncbi:hypothetical protein QYE76_009589 [Lolium multiflorum]|uniref:Uncharacterized protein n=1 Tax=Lolium multiflorum TaxID=4521 RepID=A0AAD8TVK1_LOLMU|nr:hypothetical protein QYE76_009589 [Lolium multiflorum]
MRINSEQRWSVYKETMAESQDKALDLFATKTVDAHIELDLNRRSSPVEAKSPPPMSQEELDGKDAQPDHRELTSEFIAYKLSTEISSLPTMSIRSVQDTVKSRFDYDVKYGKAWKEAWEGNDKEESVWEEAVRTVRKREKEELERKKKEEEDKKMADRARMQREYEEYLWREKKRN